MFRRPARILAPLSLVACAVAVLVIVNHTNSESDGSSSTPAQTSTLSTTSTSKDAAKKSRRRYTVKPGDVLSAIAIKTGVPLDTLIRLNPDVDAQSLQAGQKLKLAP
jgi:LysM repeat protein